ncbi:MAG: pitrilysin family protein, partial [candidate division WWE3 bacterium]|nr:pitrilysin family protein [candidate division WWE3 bacterium]
MEYKKDILKNGVRLITVPMPHLDSVTVMIGVGAGSRCEKKRVQGVAHFAEHMMFKGTKRRPTALALSSELDSLGASFNAATGEERTVYFVKSAAKNLKASLDILTDIVLNSLFRVEDLEREKGVIIEELRMYKDDPKRWVFNVAGKLIFGDHPLGRETIGTEESIRGMKRSDFIDYLQGWYTSTNMVVAVVGKIEESEVVGRVKGILGDYQVCPVPEIVKFESNQTTAGISIEERKTDQTHFILGVRAYPRNHPREEALQVLTTILGGGMSSRLWNEIREKRGLAYYIRAGWWDFADTGVFAVRGGVNNAKFEGALKVVLDELKRASEEKVPGEELAKAKEMIRGDLVL